jgi:menaquinone-dependent protoporphyrinogen oxidase
MVRGLLYRDETMANLLVLYATREGQTAKIARRIAEVVRTAGHRAELADAEALPPDFSLEPFDAACIGGPLHVGAYPPSIVRFAQRHARWLVATGSAFFSVGLAVASRTTDGRAETLRCVERFMRKYRLGPVAGRARRRSPAVFEVRILRPLDHARDHRPRGR